VVGDRQRVFAKLLANCDGTAADIRPPKPTISDIRKAGFYEEALTVYKRLGGIMGEFPCNVGKYDFVTGDFICELDEEAHFNRYRSVTLESPIYLKNKYLDSESYRHYCQQYEAFAIQHRSGGGFWTNASTEKQFGKANTNRDLTGNGSPRWKQRAFYDFLKDLVPFLFGIPLVRVSIYDSLTVRDGGTTTVNDILSRNDASGFTLVYEDIRRKIC